MLLNCFAILYNYIETIKYTINYKLYKAYTDYMEVFF